MENGTQRILVVDDEPEIAELVCTFLSGEGWAADPITNSEEALPVIETGKYDLLLTDLNMGKLSGLDLLSFVRQKSPLTSVIILTGYPSLDTAVEALRNGASEYLQKPVDFNLLREVVKRQLKAVALQQEVAKLNRQIRDERDNLRLAVAEAQLFRSFSSRISAMVTLPGVCEVLLQTIESVIALDATSATLPDLQMTMIREHRKISQEVIDHISHSSYDLAGMPMPEHDSVTYLGKPTESGIVKMVRRELRVPIYLRKKVIAAILLAREEDVPFTIKEQEFVRAIAVQVTDAFQRLSEVIEQQRSRMRRVFDSLFDGIVFLESEHAKPLLNPQAREYLELTSEEYSDTFVIGERIGVDIRETFRALKESPDENPTTSKELLTMTRGDRRLILEREVALVPMPETMSVGLLIVLHNVTYQHEIETYKRRWVANTSHELRTPTAVIKEFITLFREGALGALTQQQLEFIDVIFRNIKRLEQLIENLLTVSRMDRAVIDVKGDPVDIHLIVNDIVKGMRTVYAKKRMTLVYDENVTLPFVRGDREAIQQVISNLLDNAYKYSNEETTVIISASLYEDRFMRISVEDQGFGISAETLPKIFDRFYREPVSAAAAPGLGLGLSLVKELVDRMGGRIQTESSVGVGTTFRIILPLFATAGSNNSLPIVEGVING
ncbi:MAG: ATP-binding protein [bacterium]|nr:ATP-binding protein [bacterium]